MPASPFVEIIQPKLLVGEGREEVLFFESWLQRLGISDVQVIDYSGKAKLKSFLVTLPRIPGFGRLHTLGITRDADDDPAGAEQSVQAALGSASLPPELRIATYIMPGENKAGALETICLETLRQQPVETCIESYLRCAQEAGLRNEWSIGNAAKSRIQAWLSVQAKPGMRLGEAARAGVIDWDASCLGSLRAFLTGL